MNTIIKGRLEGDSLFTSTFVQREKARIRGAFSAFTKPVDIQDKALMSKFKESLYEPLLRELIKEKRLIGSLNRNVYSPKIYESGISSAVSRFLSQNGFIGIVLLFLFLQRRLCANWWHDGI